MKLALTAKKRSQRLAAMTLIEILVTSALLLVITLGLTAMFNQTQRAFRTSLRNADIYEGVRAAMDLVVRDLEQTTHGPSTNVHVVDTLLTPLACPPIPEVLPDASTRLHEFCFLTQISNRWIGVGYKLRSPSMTNKVGIGELFRFQREYTSLVDAGNLIDDFNAAPPDQMRHVYDGVVHMRVMPFSTNGYSPYTPKGLVNIDSFPLGTYVANDTNFFDFSNSVPAYLQFEVAVLDPLNYEQVKGLPMPAQLGYITSHKDKVHVFRQQVPIRSVQR